VSAAITALRRAIYYLDRELAPRQKVRAFSRAIDVVESLDPGELEHRVGSGTLTDLDGIGASTGAVIAAAVRGEPSTYLDELEKRTRVPLGEGQELRELLKGDCHAHSRWSDGGATIAEMAATARDLGHEYIVITDHSARLTFAHGLSEERLSAQLDEIEHLNDELNPFRVLTGLEVDILVDGALDMSDAMLARLDLVVASVHSEFAMSSHDMTRRLVTAIANPHVDVVGHITNRKLSGRGRPASDFDAEVVFAACSRFDTAVEVNCRPERRDPPGELLDLALEWGCPVAVNTDAHAPGQLEWQAFGCDKAARHGVPDELIVNTYGADELVAWASAS
jgi:putative hydrolase